MPSFKMVNYVKKSDKQIIFILEQIKFQKKEQILKITIRKTKVYYINHYYIIILVFY